MDCQITVLDIELLLYLAKVWIRQRRKARSVVDQLTFCDPALLPHLPTNILCFSHIALPITPPRTTHASSLGLWKSLWSSEQAARLLLYVSWRKINGFQGASASNPVGFCSFSPLGVELSLLHLRNHICLSKARPNAMTGKCIETCAPFCVPSPGRINHSSFPLPFVFDGHVSVCLAGP